MTRGFQPEQFVVIIGLPKSLKSSLLLYMCLEAQEQAKAPLFLGFEMSNEEQGDRMSSLLRQGQPDQDPQRHRHHPGVRRHRGGWKRRSEMRDIIFSTDMENAMTVAGVPGRSWTTSPTSCSSTPPT